MAKVLLADDSVTIHKVVEIILTAKGFTLKAVGDGETALEEVRNFKPDVVLADIEMPGLSGYELSERIKKNPSTKDIPVILLAGAFETIDNALAQKSGASSILIKPFESEDLIGKIREVIAPEAAVAKPARKPEQTGEVLEVEGLEAAEEPEEEFAEEEPFEEMPEMAGFEEFEEAPAQEELTPIEAEPEEAEAIEVVSEAELTAVEEPFEAVEEVSEAEAELTAIEEPEAVGLAEPEPVGLEEIAEPYEEEALEAAPMATTVGVPGAEVLASAFRKAADEQISQFIRSLDMKELMKEALAPALGDSVEKILWEIVPELTEKLASETLNESMKNLKKELETVIWETVPEIAEKVINKEIQRIREET